MLILLIISIQNITFNTSFMNYDVLDFCWEYPKKGYETKILTKLAPPKSIFLVVFSVIEYDELERKSYNKCLINIPKKKYYILINL